MITLTYHEIARSADSLLPTGILVSPEQLAAQLKHMLRHHEATDAGSLLQTLRAENSALPQNAFCVTFDDGFRGQYDVALDILEEHGVRGMFFVPTCVVEDRMLPTVERQRLLQYSNGPYEDFYGHFARAVRERFPALDESMYLPSHSNLSSALNYYSEYNFYTPIERLYRKVRETMLPNDVFEAIIDQLFRQSFNEEGLIEKHFLTWNDLLRMRERGHTIGGHGHKHLLESNIEDSITAPDHLHCLTLLSKHLGESIRTYAYPYGIYTSQTLDTLRGAGIELGFTCRSGRHMDGSALLTDRYDCKAFPFDVYASPSAESKAEIAAR